MHDGQPGFEYNVIDHGIYIGTNACCKAHFSEELLQNGVTADISLEAERIDAPFGVTQYLWLPTEDHAPPSPEQLRAGIAIMKELISAKQKVYVHCKNGHGRAPTLVAAYFIATGMSADEAIAFLKARRPSVHLDTPQIVALKQFEKTYKET